ncbi:diaminobutyrate--2-oxoglutarate transaminase [Desulfobulbus sp. TB]|nr:diaminobutyrate--2-oxoglutarate transaminase [Desulfobulbus sp. TB]
MSSQYTKGKELIIDTGITTIEQHESCVRNYSSHFPAVFERASGCQLTDTTGKKYIDFFSGAGALNYGHNNPMLKKALLTYLEEDNIIHSLDMATVARCRFLEEFHSTILKPRGLQYKFQFTGPTGTNAVEAAIKLARKVTGRRNILYFEHAFHGMTLGSMSLTHRPFYRKAAGVPLHYSIPVPFDDGTDDSLYRLKAWLKDCTEKSDYPAAVIVETIQAEGGVRIARFEWLQQLATLARDYDFLLIVDDIQAGCGRTGTFFSFEHAEIVPDIICLSKSLSGYGLPLSVVLIKPEYDVWEQGEHSGTFRGHNPALVTATRALTYWKTDSFQKNIAEKADWIDRQLKELKENDKIQVRGRGFIWGIELEDKKRAQYISEECFKQGVIIETCGEGGSILKLLPPLIIDQEELEQGFKVIRNIICG